MIINYRMTFFNNKKIRIKKIILYQLKIPLKSKYSHALARYIGSIIILVKSIDCKGNIGWGETAPRYFINGETINTVFCDIEKLILPKFIELQNKNKFIYFADFVNIYKNFAMDLEFKNRGSALCAFELSVLDLFGRKYRQSVHSFFTNQKSLKIQYYYPIGLYSYLKTIFFCLKYKIWKQKHIKIKLGDNKEIKRLEIINKIMGKNTKYFVDANGSWDLNKLEKYQNYLTKKKIVSFEQPFSKNVLLNVYKCKNNISFNNENKEYFYDNRLSIIADESFCNFCELKKLIDNKFIKLINIRLPKCGGIIISNMLANYARINNLDFIIGGMVGETNLLISAARSLGFLNPNFKYFVGLGKSLYLKKQPFFDEIIFKKNGNYEIMSNYNGFGCNFNNKILEKYLVRKKEIII